MSILAPALVCGCLLLGFLPRAQARSLDAQVERVIDGDTIVILDSDKRETHVRLADIDAPELHQPYGMEAKQTLAGLISGRLVHVETEGMDRYGRTIAVVSIGSIQVNEEMVRVGAAWLYAQYNRDPELPAIALAAKEAHAGLWALPPDRRIAPWIWRHAHESQ